MSSLAATPGKVNSWENVNLQHKQIPLICLAETCQTTCITETLHASGARLPLNHADVSRCSMFEVTFCAQSHLELGVD